jgi:hypothetical protein
MVRSNLSILEENVAGNHRQVAYYIRYKGAQDPLFLAAGNADGFAAFVNSPKYKLTFNSKEEAEEFLDEILMGSRLSA